MQGSSSVAGNTSFTGGGVYVFGNSTFQIENGTVTGSTSYNGLAANNIALGIGANGAALYVQGTAYSYYGTGTGSDLSTFGTAIGTNYYIDKTITGTGVQP
jgi:hypothetical protein